MVIESHVGHNQDTQPVRRRVTQGGREKYHQEKQRSCIYTCRVASKTAARNESVVVCPHSSVSAMLTWGNDEELKKEIHKNNGITPGFQRKSGNGFKAANAVMQGTLTQVHDLQYLFLAGVPGKGTAGVSEIVL